MGLIQNRKYLNLGLLWISPTKNFSGVASNTVKISYYGIVAVLLVVIAVALAGCTASKTVGTGSDSSGSSGSHLPDTQLGDGPVKRNLEHPRVYKQMC